MYGCMYGVIPSKKTKPMVKANHSHVAITGPMIAKCSLFCLYNATPTARPAQSERLPLQRRHERLPSRVQNVSLSPSCMCVSVCLPILSLSLSLSPSLSVCQSILSLSLSPSLSLLSLSLSLSRPILSVPHIHI
jgi:hypothetical protein